MLRLDYVPGQCEWIFPPGAAVASVAWQVYCTCLIFFKIIFFINSEGRQDELLKRHRVFLPNNTYPGVRRQILA